MNTQNVVIVGGGQAGMQAAASLRDNGFAGRITMLAGEGVLPYQRPPLSKGYLSDPAGADVLLRPAEFYAARDISLVTGDPAARIDRAARRVELSSGRRLRYDRLVLATGARPRTLRVPGAGLDGVLTLRTVTDADDLRRRLAPGRHLVIVGAGMIGFEVAAAARQRGLRVTIAETQPAALTRVASGVLAGYLTAEQRRRGVRVAFGAQVAGMRGDAAGRVREVSLDSGEHLPADLVVVAAGITPRAELAVAAGLRAADGVLVDEALRTSDPAIYAIGDCARYPSRHARQPVRLESVQNAVDTGRHVAAGVCGERVPYASVPWFWTDQYDAKVQIAGITQGSDDAVVSGDPASGQFSVCCFRQRRLLGVESVNRPADHIRARRLLAAPDPALTPEQVAAHGLPRAA